MSSMNADTSSAFYSGNTSYNSNAQYYDTSWLVPGMVVKEWESFCPCTLPITASSAHGQSSVAVGDSLCTISCPAPTVESFDTLMPGLLPDQTHSADFVKSYALRSSHFHPTKQPNCPVPTLWLDMSMPSDNVASAERNADIVKWLASPECQITRLIIAGPPHLQWESPNSETHNYMSSFISSVLNKLLKSTTSSICHLVFYRCSLSDLTLWPLLSKLLTRSDFPLKSLACVHLQSAGEAVEMLLQILQDPHSNLFELLLHGLSSFSFDKLLHILQSPHSQLLRLSLTACNIGDKEMEKISAVLNSPSCKLTAINLSANVFTEVGLHHLQTALLEAYTTPRTHPLEMLSLCGRQIYLRDEEVAMAMEKVLKSPGCALTTLDLTGRRLDPRWLAHLLGELKTRSNRKKLSSLYLLHASCVNSDRAPNDKLIEALKASAHILNIHFPWPTDVHKQIADAVMHRNARLKTIESVGQQEQQLEKPCRIKLFLCGHERVGKTTLRKKLLRSSSVYNLAKRVKQGMRIEEPVTQGMNLSLLELQGKTTSVVICDLAGQREYHAFHTFFMTSTNEDLFAVVCKYTAGDKFFEAKLQYWFRFIVSLRAQSEPKPMVIVVVNFFDSVMNPEQMSDYAKTVTGATMRKFSTLLDFGQSPGIHVFGVKLSSVKASRCTEAILTAVEMLSDKLMERKPLIPRICKEISSAIDHKEIKSLVQIHSKSADPIMTVQELLKKYKSRIGKRAARRNESSATATPPSDVAFEEALLELHKIGKVVYFRNDIAAAEDWCLEKQLVILDPLWFYETVVGFFVKPKSEPADASVGCSRNCQSSSRMTERRIKLMFIEENLCKREHIDRVIKYLEKLELFYPTNISGPDPCDDKQLIFPSMIPAVPQESQFNHWIEMGMPPQAYSFFGRRLDCKEKETSLIPFGVFARLQVQLHGVYGQSTGKYAIGYGWIQFCVEDKLEVFIRFEGASGRHEEDRHWIDTMVRFPVELSGLREKAADITCKVNDTVFGICRGLDRGLCAGVELEEFVLLGASPSSEVRLLSDVKEDVHSLVLRGQNIGPTINCGEITELLLPGEWRGILKQMEAAITELAEEFADSPELETIRDEALQQLIAVHELSESKFIPLHKLNEVSSKHSGSMYSRLSEQQLIRREVAAGAAPEDALPLCPYLTDEQGKFWPKLKAMVHVRGARLQLMCESFHGCHEVRSQKGVAITLGSADKRLVKAAPVLATALRLAFGAAMMAALTFSPPGASFFPLLLESLGLDDLIKKHMKFSIPQHKVAFPEFLSSYLEGLPDVQQSLLHAQASSCTGQLPSGHLLGQFYRYVLEGHDKDVDMERDFSLYHVYFPAKRRSLWVCEAHISGGFKLRPFNPFTDLYLHS